MRFSRISRWLLLALVLSVVPASSFAGVFISVGIAPPALPVYVQPVCPEPGMMWTPGYWAYGEDGYYWVPGAWVPAPYVGALWTPGYWGWGGGRYIFHDGYWGAHIGFYGGVNYGFGYMGVGFAGGEWRGGAFAYNTAVMRVNTTVIHNTYVNTTIVHNTTIVNEKNVAYSGGPGGIQHQPTPQEKVAENEKHVAPTQVQQQHVQAARVDKTSYASNNGGHPSNLAVARPMTTPAHGATAGGSTQAHTNAASHTATSSAATTPHTNTATTPHTNTAASTHTNTAMTAHTNTPAATHTNTAAAAHTNTTFNGSSSHTSSPSVASRPTTSMAPRPAAPRPAAPPRSAPPSGGGSAPRPSPSGHHK